MRLCTFCRCRICWKYIIWLRSRLFYTPCIISSHVSGFYRCHRSKIRILRIFL